MLRSSLILAILGFSGSHPIKDVINLIQELRETAKKDQENDDIEFENATHEFEVAKKELRKSIESEKTAEEENENLRKAKSDQADALGDEIAALGKRLEENKTNEAAIGEARTNENGVFIETEKTVTDTVTALQECLDELGKGTALMAVSQERMKVFAQAFLPPEDQGLVTTFLANQAPSSPSGEALGPKPSAPSSKGPGDPEARVYDTKTKTVVDLFEKLIRQFKDKLSDKQKQEQRAINAHELSVLALNGEHTSMSALKAEKESQKSEAEGARDQAKADAAAAKEAFDQFTQSLKDKEREQRDRTNNYENVKKERREEGEAMVQAVDILEQVSGVRANHESLSSPVFLQMVADSPVKDKIIGLLRTAGEKLHSAQLQKLAMEISTSEGPFNQINNMIQKMIDRLVAEQKQEDNHQAWCETEMQVSNAGKEDKTAKLKKIEADIDTANSKEASNKEDKVDARKEISDLQKRKGEETEQRRLDKKNNNVSIDDAKKAQAALQKALSVLNEFNEKRDQGVDTTAQHGKVLELLENAETHYAKLEADVESSETQAENDFQQSMADIKKTVATLEAQVQGHDNTLHRLSQKLSSLGKKKKHTRDALFELNQYLDDLKPACVGKEEGAYEKRKEQRSKEKEALKTAKQTLADAFKKKANPSFLQA